MNQPIERLIASTSSLVLAFAIGACGAPAADSGDPAAPVEPATVVAVEVSTDVPVAVVGTEAASEPAPDATAAATLGDEAPIAAKINLNDGTEAEFLTVPNVGDKMVREFMEYRPYASIQIFRREMLKYVDEDLVAHYEDYVFVPVDVNASDAETLQQLPGVDETIAADLIAGRPYSTAADFLTALGARVSAAEAAAAENYLAAP